MTEIFRPCVVTQMRCGIMLPFHREIRVVRLFVTYYNTDRLGSLAYLTDNSADHLATGEGIIGAHAVFCRGWVISSSAIDCSCKRHTVSLGL